MTCPFSANSLFREKKLSSAVCSIKDDGRLMTLDKIRQKKNPKTKKKPSDKERTLASLPVVFNSSYGMSSLPSTIRRWTGPWMVGQLGQF